VLGFGFERDVLIQDVHAHRSRAGKVERQRPRRVGQPEPAGDRSFDSGGRLGWNREVQVITQIGNTPGTFLRERQRDTGPEPFLSCRSPGRSHTEDADGAGQNPAHHATHIIRRLAAVSAPITPRRRRSSRE